MAFQELLKNQNEGEDCRICDQLMDILLIGWWWGNRVIFQESASSTFWFQPIWSLPACGQHVINFIHVVKVLIYAKQLKDMA